MHKTKFCQGISDISDSYSAFLVDQWGVLHNGVQAVPGAAECMRELKRRGKTILILSNSGKRASLNAASLKKLGFGTDTYDQIITSGEITYQGLRDQKEGYFQKLGQKCFLISRNNDRSVVEGLDIEVVDRVEDADFLLIAGADAGKTMVDIYEPILKKAIRKHLKAICANPDVRVVIGDDHVMGPGLIAHRYEDFGGVVHFVGKPHKPIFQHCIKILQEKEIYPGQTVMIGDAMAHDILGAAAVNIDTCLVRDGLHHGAFKNCHTPLDVDRALNILTLQYHNVRPTYLVDHLKWGKALPDRKHKKKVLA